MVGVRTAKVAVARFVSSPLADWLPAGAFVVLAEIEVLLTVPGPSWRQAVAAVTGLGLLVLGYRRRSPLLAMVVLCGLQQADVVVVQNGNWETLAWTLALFVVSYSVGANAGRRTFVPALSLPLVMTAVTDTLWPGQFSVAEAVPFVALFLVGLPALAGWIVRDRSRLVGRLREQSSELEAERAARADRALGEERLRVAHELHRVVSSTVHGLLAQIEAAEKEGTVGLHAVTQLEAIARQGLSDMRRLLAALTGPDRRTTLESGRLEAALADAAASGVNVTQSRQEATTELDPALELAAVRVIELFLDGASGQSRIEARHQQTGIEILLHRRGGDELSRVALAAMRERAALVGGTVDPASPGVGPGLRISLPAHSVATAAHQPAPPEPMQRPPRLANLPWPVLVAAGEFVLLQVQVQISSLLRGPRLLNALAVLAVAAPLAWCRRRPLFATTFSLLAFMAMSAFLTPVGLMAGGTVLWLVLPFSLVVFADRLRALLGLAICAASLLGSGWLGLPGTPTLSGAVGLLFTFVLAALAAGLVVRDRSRLARQLVEINQRLVHERDATARQVVIEERARVAHELHDVIGHSLTVIVLQAGAARRVWETDHVSALTSLAALARVLKGGLTDLLSSLDFIEARGQPVNVPKLDELDDVLEMARLAGVRLELHVEGEAAGLSPAAELASYRVVQEALTNAIKHAPGCPVVLAIRYGERVVELEVSNQLPVAPPGAPLGASGGHGLAGMRRRIEACGGMLEWGRREGAFSVRARLPVLS
jgi:signal transduction histidine kinase